MRVLIVGAGAVGLSYGWHLQRGGADVTYFVREKYRADAEAGFVIYPLNDKNPTRGVAFEGCGVVCTNEEVAAQEFDQIWITVSSPALRGDWLAQLLAAAPSAAVVSFTPGADDRALLLEHLDVSRLVIGLIPLIAYQAPLPGETRFDAPGLALWHPPFAKTPLSGPRTHVNNAVDALIAGGCAARAHPDVGKTSAFPTAYMMPTLVALELCDWSFDALKKSEWLARATGAAQEAATIAAQRVKVKRPWVANLVRPFTLRMVMNLTGVVIPLDTQTYLRYHFTKVGDQTRMFIDGYIDEATRWGLPHTSLSALRDALRAQDAEAAA